MSYRESRNAAAMRAGQWRHDNACPDDPPPTLYRCRDCEHEFNSDEQFNSKECPKCDSEDLRVLTAEDFL